MKNTTLSCGFDALIIAGKEKTHDSSIVDGVVLDVFVYPAETFSADYDPEEFVQVWDGKIVLDEHGIAGQLKAKVLDYIEHLPKKNGDGGRVGSGMAQKDAAAYGKKRCRDVRVICKSPAGI